MPIYEYRCSACGFEKDALQKMSDAPLVDCPSCGKPALVKQISAAGFQLKGSGWYATDFKGSGAAKPDAKAGAKPGSDTAADAEVAPASATADSGSAKAAEPAATKSESTAPKPSPTTGAGD